MAHKGTNALRGQRVTSYSSTISSLARGGGRGEKIRRKEENGGKKGKNESGRKSSSSTLAEIVCMRLEDFPFRCTIEKMDRVVGQSKG